MKKISICSMIAIIAIILTSCGGGVKEFNIKNNSTNITGDLEEYLEVVDGSYTVASVGGLKLNIKLKAIKKLEDGKKFSELRAELLDEAGMPLTGVGAFQLKYGIWAHANQIEKITNALKKGEGEIAVQLEYDSWGACGSEEALKIGSKKAKSFSMSSKLEEATENTSVSSSSSTTSDEDVNEEVVTKNSGNTNWDKILADYESYTDKYIKLLKKAKAGDASAMSEYMEMLEKAQQFQESLSDANDDLTPAQLQKFTKIQMKLANAASGL
jgi:hypothetical protein